MTDPVRIVLVDDHPMVRKGLQNVLELGGAIKVVGEASDAEEGLRVIDLTTCDVVVADLSLPGRDGIWLTQQIKESRPALPVLVLTMHIEDRMVVEALRAGASGYVLKSATYQELAQAIVQVHQMGFYLNPRLARPVMEELRSTRTPAPAPAFNVTERERSILQKASEGLSNKEIGDHLSLSESTVKSHLRTLYRKLDVPDRTQAILVGLRAGLIREPSAEGDRSAR